MHTVVNRLSGVGLAQALGQKYVVLAVDQAFFPQLMGLKLMIPEYRYILISRLDSLYSSLNFPWPTHTRLDLDCQMHDNFGLEKTRPTLELQEFTKSQYKHYGVCCYHSYIYGRFSIGASNKWDISSRFFKAKF